MVRTSTAHLTVAFVSAFQRRSRRRWRNLLTQPGSMTLMMPTTLDIQCSSIMGVEAPDFLHELWRPPPEGGRTLLHSPPARASSAVPWVVRVGNGVPSLGALRVLGEIGEICETRVDEGKDPVAVHGARSHRSVTSPRRRTARRTRTPSAD